MAPIGTLHRVLGDSLKPIIVQDCSLALLALLALHMPVLCLATQAEVDCVQMWTAC